MENHMKPQKIGQNSKESLFWDSMDEKDPWMMFPHTLGNQSPRD